MPKRYIENTGAAPLLVGGVFIPPGEGREVDEALLPSELQAPPQDFAETQPPQPDLALLVEASELLKRPLKDILPLLEGMDDERLATLSALEGAAPAPRVTLTQAIAKLQLDRANAKLGNGEPAVDGTSGAGGDGGTGSEGGDPA